MTKARLSESYPFIGADLSYLDRILIDAGPCSNCCINEALDVPHHDCAGPEGYQCDCPCEGEEFVGEPFRS